MTWRDLGYRAIRKARNGRYGCGETVRPRGDTDSAKRVLLRAQYSSGSIRAKSRPIAPNRATWDMLAQIGSSSTKVLSRRWATAGRGGTCQLDNTSHSYAGQRYEPVLWVTPRKSPLAVWACMEVRTRPCCRSESSRISLERHPSHDLQTGGALPSRWRGLFMTRKSAGLVRP